jgi:hypothetical protein
MADRGPETATVVAFRRGGGGPSREPRAGDTLGERWLLVKLLGSGGNGAVFLAQDLRLEREVALKLVGGMHADWGTAATRVQRFLGEARLLAKLEHPNIVPVHDAGEIEGVPYIAMRLARGRTLRTLVDAEGTLPVARAVELVSQLCAGLEAAHARGILHRDVKPANVMVEEGDAVQVVDFGISQLRKDAVEAAGIQGTVQFIAPEIWEGGAASPRSDLYAAAVTFYYLLAGSLPFGGSTIAEVEEQVVRGAPVPIERHRADVPPGIRRELHKAMARAPEDRHQDVASFASALRRALLVRRLLRWGGVAAVLTALVAAAGGWWWATRPVRVEAQVMAEAQLDGVERVEVVVSDTTPLRAGDSFWLQEVTPTRDCRAVVLMLDTEARLQRLAPQAGGGPAPELRAREAHRIPEVVGHAWVLDQARGIETVFLAVSTDSLDAGALAEAETEARLAVRAAAPPEAVVTRGVGGVVVTGAARQAMEDAAEEALRRRFDAVRRFRILHQ